MVYLVQPFSAVDMFESIPPNILSKTCVHKLASLGFGRTQSISCNEANPPTHFFLARWAFWLIQIFPHAVLPEKTSLKTFSQTFTEIVPNAAKLCPFLSKQSSSKFYLMWYSWNKHTKKYGITSSLCRRFLYTGLCDVLIQMFSCVFKDRLTSDLQLKTFS